MKSVRSLCRSKLCLQFNPGAGAWTVSERLVFDTRGISNFANQTRVAADEPAELSQTDDDLARLQEEEEGGAETPVRRRHRQRHGQQHHSHHRTGRLSPLLDKPALYGRTVNTRDTAHAHYWSLLLYLKDMCIDSLLFLRELNVAAMTAAELVRVRQLVLDIKEAVRVSGLVAPRPSHPSHHPDHPRYQSRSRRLKFPCGSAVRAMQIGVLETVRLSLEIADRDQSVVDRDPLNEFVGQVVMPSIQIGLTT